VGAGSGLRCGGCFYTARAEGPDSAEREGSRERQLGGRVFARGTAAVAVPCRPCPSAAAHLRCRTLPPSAGGCTRSASDRAARRTAARPRCGAMHPPVVRRCARDTASKRQQAAASGVVPAVRRGWPCGVRRAAADGARIERHNTPLHRSRAQTRLAPAAAAEEQRSCRGAGWAADTARPLRFPRRRFPSRPARGQSSEMRRRVLMQCLSALGSQSAGAAAAASPRLREHAAGRMGPRAVGVLLGRRRRAPPGTSPASPSRSSSPDDSLVARWCHARPSRQRSVWPCAPSCRGFVCSVSHAPPRCRPPLHPAHPSCAAASAAARQSSRCGDHAASTPSQRHTRPRGPERCRCGAASGMQALHRPRLRRCRCALSCTWAIIACSLQGRRRNGAARVQPGAGACFSAERPAGGPCLPQHQPRACSGAVACNPSACQFVTLASRWRSHKQCRCLGGGRPQSARCGRHSVHAVWCLAERWPPFFAPERDQACRGETARTSDEDTQMPQRDLRERLPAALRHFASVGRQDRELFLGPGS
jgi:hypothetical protein